LPEGVSSVDGSGGNQDQTGPRSGTSVDDEVKHDTEKGPEEVVAKHNKAQGKDSYIRVEVVASSQQQPNQIVWFDKSDHPIFPGSVQKGVLKRIAPRTALSTGSLLVSSRLHTQPGEEDPVDEGAEDDGRNGWEGER
jgi:hypothetical protein